MDMINLMTSKLFFFFTSTQYLHSYDVKKHSVLIGQTVLDGKMFRKGNGFPDSAESITFTENFFCSDVLQLSSEYVFPAKISKFVKLLWGPFSVVNYSSQVVQGISVRQNDA